MELATTVVLDPDFETGRAFGTQGTPSAVLVDPDGKVASRVLGGANAVFRLLAPGPQGPVAAASQTS